MRRTLPYAVALVTFIAGGAIAFAVQRPAAAPVAHPALSGFWALSDASPGGGKAPDQVEAVPMGGAPRPGTGASDGAGMGSSGGRGGFVPGSSDTGGVGGNLFSDWGNKLPSTKPKRLTATEALRKELLTPPEEFSIDLSAQFVVINDGVTGPVKYQINGKSEAHQFTNGSAKTKTSWDGPLLRQVIDPGGSKLARVFELTDDGLLLVTVGETGAVPVKFAVVPEGKGGAKPLSNETPKSLYKRKG